MLKPNYQDGSIVNLMSSLLSALGGKSSYLPLKFLPPEKLKDSRNIVLLLLDGIGTEFLNKFATGSVIYKNKIGEMTSTFPSATASAITSFVTGLAPQQHGITGWFTYLEPVGKVSVVLPGITRAERKKIKINFRKLFSFPTISEQIQADSFAIVPKAHFNTPYNHQFSFSGAQALGYRSLDGMFQKINQALNSPSSTKKFIYAYWPGFDAVCHEKGYTGREARHHFREIEKRLQKFLQKIKSTNTTIIITADHGQIETTPQQTVVLHYQELKYLLALPLCGEPRALFCYVQEGKKKEFEQFYQKKLKRYCHLYQSEKLLQQNFFGIGKIPPQFFSRIGHYTLILKKNYVINDLLPREKRHLHKGNHGGLSREEMLVPLAMIKK